jgi:hypothetical protein
MDRPSKEERKRLRRQVEASQRTELSFMHVVSPMATVECAGPDLLVEEIAKLQLALSYRPVGQQSFVFQPPNTPQEIAIVVGYSQLDDAVLLMSKRYQLLVSDKRVLQLGTPMISTRTILAFHPVNAILDQVVRRALGRLTKGTIISDVDEYICDDWQAWTYDWEPADFRRMSFRNSDLERALQDYPDLLRA